MKLLQLNMNQMENEDAVYQFLTEQLQWPDSYEKSLDVLYELLAAELQENICIEYIRCADEASSLYEFSKKLEQTMEDAAQTIEEKEGTLYAVFADIRPLQNQSMW